MMSSANPCFSSGEFLVTYSSRHRLDPPFESPTLGRHYCIFAKNLPKIRAHIASLRKVVHDRAYTTYVVCYKRLTRTIWTVRRKALKTPVAPLIRARSVVQVHPGPPFKSPVNTRLFFTFPLFGDLLQEAVLSTVCQLHV